MSEWGIDPLIGPPQLRGPRAPKARILSSSSDAGNKTRGARNDEQGSATLFAH